MGRWGASRPGTNAASTSYASGGRRLLAGPKVPFTRGVRTFPAMKSRGYGRGSSPAMAFVTGAEAMPGRTRSAMYGLCVRRWCSAEPREVLGFAHLPILQQAVAFKKLWSYTAVQ